MPPASSVPPVVTTAVVAIEAQILPRLQGSAPFRSVAIGRRSRVVSRPVAGTPRIPTALPRLGRAGSAGIDWQRDDAFILAYVVQGEVDIYAGKRRVTCPIGTFAMVFPGVWRGAANAPYGFRATASFCWCSSPA